MATHHGAGRTKKTLRIPELAVPTIFLLALPVVIVASGGIAALGGYGVAGGVLYALLLVLALRVLRCRVTLDKDEIVQHTVFGSRHIPARTVAAVKLRQLGPLSPPYPTLHLRDGSVVGLAYAGGYVIGGGKNGAAIRSFYDHLGDTRPTQ